MTQITINIENPLIVPTIKKMLALIEGVTIATPTKTNKDRERTKEKQAIFSAFKQVSQIKEGTIKTRDVNDLLKEYGC